MIPQNTMWADDKKRQVKAFLRIPVLISETLSDVNLPQKIIKKDQFHRSVTKIGLCK